jgi:uncharacterized small protein (DUF1192 family)
MQWLINEFKQFKKDVGDRVDLLQKQVERYEMKEKEEAALWVGVQPEAIRDRITKLEGEIRALKARMGKKTD